MLATEAAAVDWFRDAFGHLKAIAACNGTREHLFKAAGIKPDPPKGAGAPPPPSPPPPSARIRLRWGQKTKPSTQTPPELDPG